MLKKNIIAGLFWQSFGLIATFISIPFSIKYLGEANYGLWIAIYVTTLWVSTFDFGVPSSFRNRLARAFARKEKLEQLELISTTYFFILMICLITISLVFLVNVIYIFSPVLVAYITPEYLHLVSYLIVIVVLDMLFKVILTIYTADQRAAMLPACTSISNVLILVFVFIIYKLDFAIANSKIYTYAMIIPVIPLLINSTLTVMAFFGRYSNLRPRIVFISKKLLKNLLGLGIGFFLIQVSMAVFTQISNLLIAIFSSPSDVTLVNIAEKYFGLVSIIGAIVLFPFWSKFTESDAKHEYDWIKNTLVKLEYLFIFTILLSILALLIFPSFCRLWIGKEIEIPLSYSIVILVKYLAILYNSIFSYYLNSIGKIKIQIVVYMLLAILSYPLSYLLYINFGTIGVILYTCIGLFCLALLQRYYSFKIINQKINNHLG